MTQIMAVPIVMMISLIAIYVLSFGLGIPIEEVMGYGIGISGVLIFLSVSKLYVERDTDQSQSQSAQS